ncbi:MAG: S41 family peptidase [Planctomycetota bacterium]
MTRNLLYRFIVLLLVSLFATAAGAMDAAPSERTVENLRAFAKLYGYVRFFHPSDEAAETDWDTFAVYGAERVLAVGDGGDLAGTLEELFVPLAPTLRIFPDGSEPPAPEVDGLESTEGLKPVAWQHRGVYLGNPGAYRSARTNRVIEIPTGGPGFGTVIQGIPAAEHRGKAVRLRAAVRAEVEGSGNQAQLWLRVDREKRQRGFFNNMGDRPITSAEWKVYEVEGTVADDAARIVFGGFLKGSGKAWLDAFEVAVRGDGEEKWQPVSLQNAGFEADGDTPSDWSAKTPGYSYTVTDEGHAGKRSVLVTPEVRTISEPLFDGLPSADERVAKTIGAGLRIDMPLVLWTDGGPTLGKHPRYDAAKLRQTLAGFDVASRGLDDRPLSVGAVVIVWNIFQHFYPYFDVVDVDWDAELSLRLAGALTAAAANAMQQYENLQRLVAAIQDGHGNVHSPQLSRPRASLGWTLEWIEDQVVVVASAIDGVERGDVVVSIDGEDAVKILEREMELRSGSLQWRRYGALSSVGRGEKGSDARITLRRADGEHTAVVVRDFAGRRPRENEREPIEPLDDGFFYVDISTASMDQILERIEELAASPGVIFDLRGYPSGNHDVISHLSDTPIESARWNKPQIIFPDRERIAGWDTSGRWHMQPKTPRFGKKPVFLTDGRAISYAESFLGIIEAYNLAEIVGAPTAGTNGNTNPFRLPGGYRVSWTGMRVVKHDGSQHHLVGIQPTVPVERTLAGVRAGRDEVLEKGLEILRKSAEKLE